MTRPITKLLVAAAGAAALMSATPASAFWWQCIAKDSAGNSYEGKSFGLISPWIRSISTDRAMAKCTEAGGKSCKIESCVDLDTLPREPQ